MFWATGTHAAGWRYPGARSDGAFDIEFMQEVTKIAEDAKFDFLFLGDKLATDARLQTTNPAQMTRLEPFTIAGALAASTSKIGIVVTANPTYYDPYTIARLTASLDHLTKGRASWNIVTGADGNVAHNFSRPEHWNNETRYDWADEFIPVVRELWDSWEDDAFVRNRETGQFVDHDKLHILNHRGRHLTVAGPLNVARPPQGHIVLLHAGTSDRSREFGARESDVIFSGPASIEEARDYYADVKARARRYGREDHELSILPGLTPIVAETTEEAVAIYDKLNSLLVVDPDGEGVVEDVRFGRRVLKRNLASVSEIIGVDVRGYERDAVVPGEIKEQVNVEGKRIFAEITRLTRRDVVGEKRITFWDLIFASSSKQATTVVAIPRRSPISSSIGSMRGRPTASTSFRPMCRARSRPSPTSSFPSCKSAACSAAIIVGRPCATIWVSYGRRTAS
jgi:FMN-dependent oxidoreductase (nitrilotriacetate monooxygenase family)